MFDVTAMGELLIDFTPCGTSAGGRALFEQNPGGAPANVLVAVSRLGLKGAFIGKVGKDMHGEMLKETLEADDIDVSGLVVDPNYFTTLAFVQLKDGERDFAFARKPGADTQITVDEVELDVVHNTYIFHFGSLSLTDEPSRSATFYAIEEARDAGAIISYDPNYRAPLWKDERTAKIFMRDVIPYVDIMKISDEETRLLTGVDDPMEAAEKLLDQGVKCVVVTLGAGGATMCTKNFTVQADTVKREVVDTTGAGDSFWGGMLAQFAKYRVKPDSITEAQAKQFINFANTVAGLTVEKRGAIPAIPDLEAVEKELKQD
ncbi:carbohydrate kinase family protein [Catenisphaera adipataccumulans]|jgi:fructokinase|uniref:Fructokinase n=1 Tax=Catenisphaera adipataccumulans TaxID=700500 RepID=A0A7W8CY02_9FIRM|nr:carbohydrate kinase [Catenisphaera adipataccumulans]MBB5182479.1 fructokinase [Catenisphaera adipataccumulans]